MRKSCSTSKAENPKRKRVSIVPLAINAESSQARRACKNGVRLATLALLQGPFLIFVVINRIVKRGKRGLDSGLHSGSG